MGKYYDGSKLLSLMDIDGNPPEIYMVTTNRTIKLHISPVYS